MKTKFHEENERMGFFSKWRSEESKIYKQEINTLSKRIDSLTRVIKYAVKDKITFQLIPDTAETDWPHFCLGRKTLYIYEDMNEFSVDLLELDGSIINNASCSFSINDNIIEFGVTASTYGLCIRYIFLIDYKNQKYIVKSKADVHSDFMIQEDGDLKEIKK